MILIEILSGIFFKTMYLDQLRSHVPRNVYRSLGRPFELLCCCFVNDTFHGETIHLDILLFPLESSS